MLMSMCCCYVGGSRKMPCVVWYQTLDQTGRNVEGQDGMVESFVNIFSFVMHTLNHHHHLFILFSIQKS